ncbi:MAG: putative bifunctional diguanylate cyclase/phosphodiesterase [Steroidobacteraceae bacterium]
MAAALALCSFVPLGTFALSVLLLDPAALSSTVRCALIAAALLGAACAGAAAVHLAHRYAPALRAARESIAGLEERRFHPPRAIGADEPRDILDALARSASALEERFRTIETLAEVDHLLLASAGVEPVLEVMLARIRALTQCHGVGITLRDGDARGRGRVYVAAAGFDDLPVSRVALDGDMMTTLAASAQGLTVARFEEGRHSFLQPLRDAGAEVFWVWPVIVSDRLEAILAIGFTGIAAVGPSVTRCGSAFAARLAVALGRRGREERLFRQAHFDPLTALPNRLLFRERLSEELARSSSEGSRGALLYIDLDHFKRVNDSFGHGVGDQVLTVIAQRLCACVKEGDVVARLGGDEFAIVLQQVADSEAASAIAARIAESLEAPVVLGTHEHLVSASIGGTLFRGDGAALDELVRDADSAMYRAKELGRGRFMIFDGGSMSTTVAPASSTGLHRALRKREFSLFYQPQFAVDDGALAGMEALLRWHSPRDGLRQPEDFVPAAEESGLIVDIGGWVLDAACAQLALWRERGIEPPRLSVNVCAQQLEDAEFPRTVRRALDKYALPAELIELEVTHDALAGNASAAAVARLVQLGVRLALEDFNAGQPGASELKSLPVSVVKLDRALLRDVPHDGESSALVEESIRIAHTLGKRVVAKGIERIEQLDFLRERGCDVAQGFYLARPLSAGALMELLLARSAAAAGDAAVREAG